MYNISPELEPLFVRLQVIIGGKSGLHWSPLTIGSKHFLAVQVFNFLDGVRHRALVIRDFLSEDASAILTSESVIAGAFQNVEMGMAGHLNEGAELESSRDLPFSNRLFIFTDCPRPSRQHLLGLLKTPDRRIAIIDDTEWERRLAMRKPDAFIAHDSRDKDDLARPLAHALSRLGLIVWFDEFSLKPGDRLSESIDRGLTDCRHAVLLATPYLLENTSWASTEMSALLTRAVDTPNVIIPVWSGVDRKDVAARSARVADIVAIHGWADIDELASKLYAAVGGPEGVSAARST
jgi:hypothetical protein